MLDKSSASKESPQAIPGAPVVFVTALSVLCCGTFQRVLAEQAKPNCTLGIGIEASNESGGYLDCGYVGVTEHGEIRASRNAFIFAPRKGRLGGSVGYEDFYAGTYLLFLDWEPPNAKKSGGFPTSLLHDYFMTRWITVKEGEDKVVRLYLMAPGTGRFTVTRSPSTKHRSVWLLPWGGVGEAPPDIKEDQQWRLAFKLNVKRAVDQDEAVFDNLPLGSYRVFLVEHERELEKLKKIDACRVLNSANVNVGKRERPKVNFSATNEIPK